MSFGPEKWRTSCRMQHHKFSDGEHEWAKRSALNYRRLAGIHDGTVTASVEACMAALAEVISVQEHDLSADEGRQDALLCVRPRGGFLIAVDPAPSPVDRTAEHHYSDAASFTAADRSW